MNRLPGDGRARRYLPWPSIACGAGALAIAIVGAVLVSLPPAPDATASVRALYSHVPYLVVAGVLVILGVWSLIRWARAASYRRRLAHLLASGSRHLASVAIEEDATELSAAVLAAGGREAKWLAGVGERNRAQTLELYRGEARLYARLPARLARTIDLTPAEASRFQATAARLDREDEALALAASLYGGLAGFEDAWSKTVDPLLKAPEAARAMLAQVPASGPDAPVEQALHALDSIRARVPELRTTAPGRGLGPQGLAPVVALFEEASRAWEPIVRRLGWGLEAVDSEAGAAAASFAGRESVLISLIMLHERPGTLSTGGVIDWFAAAHTNSMGGPNVSRAGAREARARTAARLGAGRRLSRRSNAEALGRLRSRLDALLLTEDEAWLNAVVLPPTAGRTAVTRRARALRLALHGHEELATVPRRERGTAEQASRIAFLAGLVDALEDSEEALEGAARAFLAQARSEGS